MITKTKYYLRNKELYDFYNLEYNTPLYIEDNNDGIVFEYKMIKEDGTTVDECTEKFIKNKMFCYLDVLKEKFK